MEKFERPKPLQSQIFELRNKNEKRKIFELPFCESDILELQKMFTTNGVHHLKTTNVHMGRSIVTTILKSLNHYHKVGCVTTEKKGLQTKEVCDIYKTIASSNEYHHEFLIATEQFFIEHPFFDFIWVELTSDILTKMTHASWEHMLTMIHAQERLPAILTSYTEE